MATLPVGSEWKEGHEEDMSTILDCYCPNCGGGKAITTMLPTKVPAFREIIVMALDCEECGFRNSEVSFGGEIQEKGMRLTLTVKSPDDFNRQIIKSDSASILIPKLEFEIPPTTQKGTISTMEGFFRRAATNLEELQPERLRLGDVDNFHRCRAVIQKLRKAVGDKVDDEDEQEASLFPFELILDDPAGNSFIENPFAPDPDPQLQSMRYNRTPTQDMSLGLQPSQQAIDEGRIDDANPQHKNVANTAPAHGVEKMVDKVSGEVLRFPTTCPHCYKPAETDMCTVDLPHFKEVIIMSLLCEECGFKSNEIKAGGAIPKFGAKITLRVTCSDDLEREVLKSDTAGIEIPELELKLDEGGLDGLYTTVEGLLNKMRDRLKSANPFGSGDAAVKQHLDNDGSGFSGPAPAHVRYMAFLEKLKDMANGKVFPFTLIISDPLANSFVGPVPKDALALSLQAEKDGNNQCYEDYEDAGMDVEEYVRSHDQNEILGLNDMKTENYQAGDKDRVYYGTDAMEEVPDRIRRVDIRGPDHPHEVGKAPVEGDNTVMGAKSSNFAVPSIAKRGKAAVASTAPVADISSPENGEKVRKLLHDIEYKDDAFMMNDDYDGPRVGMVYKDGAQGQGYYTDIPLLTLWKQAGYE